MADVPASNTQEYLWWAQGASDNQRARNEGLPYKIRDLRDMVADIYKLQDGGDEENIVLFLARIYCPDKLRRKFR